MIKKNNIKNVDLKRAPRWSKVQGGGSRELWESFKVSPLFVCAASLTAEHIKLALPNLSHWNFTNYGGLNTHHVSSRNKRT